MVQLPFALNANFIDKRAVGAVEVLHECLIAAQDYGAMFLADNRVGRPQVALRVAANGELREGDRDFLAL